MAEFGIIDTNCWQETVTKHELRSFINTDVPQIIHIIKTGWEHPQMYSVVIEDGEMGYPDLEFLDADQIKSKFNINLSKSL